MESFRVASEATLRHQALNPARRPAARQGRHHPIRSDGTACGPPDLQSFLTTTFPPESAAFPNGRAMSRRPTRCRNMKPARTMPALRRADFRCKTPWHDHRPALSAFTPTPAEPNISTPPSCRDCPAGFSGRRPHFAKRNPHVPNPFHRNPLHATSAQAALQEDSSGPSGPGPTRSTRPARSRARI